MEYYGQALPLRREVGDRAGEAATLTNIAGIRFQEGDLAGAKDALERVLEVVRAVGDRGSEAMVSFNMAVLLVAMGRAVVRRSITCGGRWGWPSRPITRISARCGSSLIVSWERWRGERGFCVG